MELKAELLAVLEGLGANEREIGSLMEHYVSQLAAADASVATLMVNISSLQTQLAEETERANRIRAGIGKFVAPAETKPT